jgi:hypothetical protein
MQMRYVGLGSSRITVFISRPDEGSFAVLLQLVTTQLADDDHGAGWESLKLVTTQLTDDENSAGWESPCPLIVAV